MKIRKIYIDQAVADCPETIDICTRMDIPAEYIDNVDSLFRTINACDDPQSAGKRSLLLTRNKSRFVRKCPGTTHYTCCHYHILHIASYCVMDCAYCILQAYFHPPLLTFFVNHDDMKNELDNLFASQWVYRIGTGEFTDSLIWEPIYPLAPVLVRLFAGRDNAMLELKTKTAAVDGLMNLEHLRNTVISWSLNTKRVIREQERGTASLEERINAAATCQVHGYPLAFHFDPMIWYAGCEEEYDQVVNALFNRIDPGNIVWISLGSFRFMPQLHDIVENRFPRSRIIYGDFIRGIDGKMRYFKPLRIRLYRSIVERIRAVAPDVTLYFCMEDDEVWRSVLGYIPDDYGGLPKILDKSASEHCGLGMAYK